MIQMKNDQQKLGRGLAAFFDNNEDLSDIIEDCKSDNNVKQVEIKFIDSNPFQPRRFFDEESLAALSASIKENGVIQPILVQPNGDRFILIAGERRLKASKLAGLEEIPCIITQEFSEEKLLEIAILENIQREDLDSVEEAEGYQKLIDSFSYTQEQLSERLGKSRSHITNILRLNLLPETIKNLVHQRKLSFGHARSLIGIPNAEAIAEKIISEGLSVRQVEKIIQNQKIKFPQQEEKVFFRNEDPEKQNLEAQLKELVGLDVNLKLKQNHGSIEIKFKDFNELDSLMKRLNKLAE